MSAMKFRRRELGHGNVKVPFGPAPSSLELLTLLIHTLSRSSCPIKVDAKANRGKPHFFEELGQHTQGPRADHGKDIFYAFPLPRAIQLTVNLVTAALRHRLTIYRCFSSERESERKRVKRERDSNGVNTTDPCRVGGDDGFSNSRPRRASTPSSFPSYWEETATIPAAGREESPRRRLPR